ncbi:uncharacterized protein F5147DRAFT_746322 [Suillus discolor]|uniref:Uncharacterized protein n=1 Tax=Suillus discolor TaxID=1912936 RepID=A0A9P7F474_9AGAM|nr:uncharacterized protein F5147DRAFT_746322 [Suillus discolor]KAG2106172.1 hypothetical protein F5147DRAFT_746322 [Suillus discolor]
MSHSARRDHSAHQIPCGYLHCECHFKTQAGRTKNWNTSHPTFTSAPTASVSYSATVEDEPEEPHDTFFIGHDDFPAGSFDAGQTLNEPDNMDMEFWGPGDRLYCNYHPKLNGHPCDATGQFLADGATPAPPPSKSRDDWTPYRNRIEFETVEFLYTRNQMSAGNINILLDLWVATLLKHNDKPPFADCRDLYKTIDSTPVGDVKWQSFKIQYMGEKPAHDVPPWMTESHDVWYRDPHEVIRNMLANPDYATEMDYQPYREFLTDNNERQWQDFMSSDWAWNQADIISQDSDTAGSTFMPVILRSDKTTVSVATGANDYYPLYTSIGNVRNNVRCTHRDAEHAACPKYRKYRRQLFHSSISKILENLKPGMMKPEVVRFGDGHYRRVIYGLGPYIADYEEQVLLACIVRSWCPRCMSHCKNLDSKSLCRNRDHTEALIDEVTSSDLWDEYGIIADLVPFTNDFPRGDIHELIAPDILHQLIKGTFKDHLVEIAVVASFSGFKQWTSDDSKALMKVYLPAIKGYVPTDVVRTFRAFLKFCYLVRRNIITESTLVYIQDALDRFHHYRNVFELTGVVFTFSLPRQHSCSHYALLIRLFGAPDGLCSSITKTKHIKAVKEPWRRSSRYHALGQMLVTNQCLDKLAASCINFKSHGMLNSTCLSETLQALMHLRLNHEPEANELNDDTITPLPDRNITIQGDNEEGEIVDGPTSLVQAHVQLAKTHHNDCSGIGGMRREHIRAYAAVEGMGGMDIGHVMCFFSFTFEEVSYPCAVVRWFEKANDGPDEDTGMWIVKPSYDTDHSLLVGIIHINSIYWAAHLIPIYGTHTIPKDLKHYDSYDAFCAFYVNKFADHHAFEIAS